MQLHSQQYPSILLGPIDNPPMNHGLIFTSDCSCAHAIQHMEETPEDKGKYRCSADELMVLLEATGNVPLALCRLSRPTLPSVLVLMTSCHFAIFNRFQDWD